METSNAKENVILEMTNITKRFPGVTALSNVNFNLRAGEVHVLLGENGAGKSTLIKVITGAYIPDEGTIKYNNEEIKLLSPTHAIELGISAVYQEFNLIPYLNAGENVFLGKEPLTGKGIKFINRKEVYQKTREALDQMGADIDIHLPVCSFGVATQQMIEIAKALNSKAKVLILDEPTAVLTEKETKVLFETIRNLTASGVGIVYISHRLEELNEIADRVTVLRDGEYVTTLDVEKGKVDKDELIRMMVGRNITELFPKSVIKRGPELLKLENVCQKGVLENINLTLHRGEILGIGGLVGAGRTELAKAIFGESPIDSGTIYVDEKPVEIKNPTHAIELGIGLAPENRKEEGLVQIMEIDNNINLASMDFVCNKSVINKNKLFDVSNSLAKKLRIVTPSVKQHVENLSGGNQQKVVLAKWLATKAKIVILDEPTRGIDVGAKVEVYQLMNELISEGVGIIMISSELPELLAMSDRIIVMRGGSIRGELSVEEATQEKILTLAAGGIINETN